MRRGEVYWHQFGKPDKRRPVVVLTATRSLHYLDAATVASVTRTRRGVPSEVELSVDDGLPQVCAVNLHQIATVPQRHLGPYITQLTDSRMREIDDALTFALGVGERLGDA